MNPYLKHLFDALSFAWSRLWSPLLAASLVGGINYSLRRRDERRDLRKKLSSEIYIPARRQLSEAEQAIRESKRAHSIDTDMWKRAHATGIAENLKSSIKSQLAVLYEDTLPNHDRAWQDLSNELTRVGGEWDLQYADVDYALATLEHNIVPIVWWDFLTPDAHTNGRSPSKRRATSLESIHEPRTIQVIKSLGRAVLDSAMGRDGRNDFMRRYRDYRQRALAQIPKAIASLSREALY
jgi:hypothetical protein